MNARVDAPPAAAQPDVSSAGEMWHALMLFALDAIVILSEDARVVSASRSFSELLGYTPDELSRMHAWDWDVQWTRSEVLENVREDLKAAHGCRTIETQVRRRDGTILDVEISVSWMRKTKEGGRFICIMRDIGGRKAVEKALAKQTRLREEALASAVDSVVLIDLDAMTLVEANPAFARMLGYEPSEVIGLHPWDWDAGHARDDILKLRAALLGTEAEPVTGFESVFRRKDGRLLDVEVSGSLFTLDGTNYSYGIVRDITERKAAERALVREATLRRMVSDNTQDGIALISISTLEVVEVNAAFAGFLQRAPEEIIGRSPWDWDAQFSKAEILTLRGKDSDGRPARSLTFETRFRRTDGSLLDVELSNAYFTLDGDEHVYCVARDITERKRSERALHRKEEEIRTLVENIPDAIVRYDRQLRRIFINGVMGRFLDLPPERLLEEPLGGPLDTRAPAVFVDALQETFRTGQARKLQLQGSGPDAQSRWSHVHLVPELNEAGEVETVLSIVRDVSELVRQQKRLERLAYNDPLTGLASRAGFNKYVSEALSSAQQRGASVGLLVFDLDRFKDINDSLGHAAGDELLRQTSERLPACIRHGDFLSRLGGDEFAVVLPDIDDGAEAGPVADAILQALHAPFRVCGREIFASASIGIAVYPHDGTNADELFAHADVAMYDAKKHGRGGVQFYAEDLSESATQRLALSTALRSACANDEFELLYQPKVRLSDGCLIGAEALLRWHHPEFGLLNPDTFVPIAEETGTIVEIGQWVLANACRTAVDWNRGRAVPLHMAVNLSCRQFALNDLVGDVRRVLENTGCRGDWLECEITESLILRDELDVHGALERLSAMGVSIAIDDFGTGHSALSYLNRFHVDVLKIDRSFVDGMQRERRKAELVKAFISLAHALDMDVVAEGIENSEQTVLLQRLGCGIGQGYHLGKPLPPDEFRRRHLSPALAQQPRGAAPPGTDGTTQRLRADSTRT